MHYELVTPPAAEPVSLDEAKLHLRVDSTEENDYITALVTAARELAERFTNRSLITQTWRAYADGFDGELELHGGPVQSVTSVKYIDSDGVEQTVPSTDYVLENKSRDRVVTVRLAYGKSWPSARSEPGAVRVQYVAGYGTTGVEVPAGIRTAMKQIFGHWYANRETVVTGTIATEVPQSGEMLLWPYRLMRFA